MGRRADGVLLFRPGLRWKIRTQADRQLRPYPFLRGLRRDCHRDRAAACPGRSAGSLAAAALHHRRGDDEPVHGDRELAQRAGREPPARQGVRRLHGRRRPWPGARPGPAGAEPDPRLQAAAAGRHLLRLVPDPAGHDPARAPGQAGRRAAGSAFLLAARAAGAGHHLHRRPDGRRLLRPGAGLRQPQRPGCLAIEFLRRHVHRRRLLCAVAAGLAVRPPRPQLADPRQCGAAVPGLDPDVGAGDAAVLVAASIRWRWRWPTTTSSSRAGSRCRRCS